MREWKLGWIKFFIFLMSGVFLNLGWGTHPALGQSLNLTQTSPAPMVMGGQPVIYNFAYFNSAVPVTTLDNFEGDTPGTMPAGWVTYGGSRVGSVISETVTASLNGTTEPGNQAVSAVFNYGCSPFCGRLDYISAGSVTDGSIQADIYFPNSGDAAGLIWRNDVNNNQYQMTFSQGTLNNINLVAQDNSPYKNLVTSSANINIGQWYTVKLAVSGINPVLLTAYVNGTVVATASTTISLGPGYPGLQVQGASAVIFDNVQVVQSPDADGVSFIDDLPNGLSYVSSSIGAPVFNGSNPTWNLGIIVAGSAATVQMITTGNNCNESYINTARFNVGAPSGSVTSNPVTVLAVCSPTPSPPAPDNKPYVFSNPSSGPTVNFVYNMAGSGTAFIRVWNASGVLAASLQNAQSTGIQQSVLNIQSFAPGHYFYQVDLKYDSGGEDRFQPEVLAVEK